MKYLFTCLMFLGLSVHSQSTIKPEIQKGDTTFYIRSKNYSGYIFPMRHEAQMEGNKRFTPDAQEIEKGEKALASLYYHPRIMGQARLYPHKVLIDLSPYFSNYKRQYAGYFNEEGQKILVINILNLSNKQEANKNFDNWKHRFILGFDGFYEHNYDAIEFNISNQKIE